MAETATDKPPVKHPGGRPLKIPTPEEFTALADAFFAECDEKKRPYTITGLALACGFSSRRDLINYAQRPEFLHAVNSAKARVEAFAESRLYEGPATGPIFALKNFGWSDTQDINLSGHVTNDVRSLGVVVVSDPAQLSKMCEAMRIWQQKKNQLSEKQADAVASPSHLEKLHQERQSEPQESQAKREAPPRKQW